MKRALLALCLAGFAACSPQQTTPAAEGSSCACGRTASSESSCSCDKCKSGDSGSCECGAAKAAAATGHSCGHSH
jgi:hypothetical protein